ncbi:MAG: 5-methylcytosine restriction system specificity protein McrC [Janthinobacterium lividum]
MAIVVLREHAEWEEQTAIQPGLDGTELRFGGRKDDEGLCVAVREIGDTWLLKTHYYVGAGWLRPGEVAVQVRPKLNEAERSIDHLRMLFACLGSADVAPYVGELYELDLEALPIELPRQDDLLTPMLVAHFLHLVRTLVRQGLRKGYNPVKRELRGRIKGKIEVAKTLRQGALKGRPLSMACAFEEFSLDIPENRLLKQALRFAGRYLQGYPALENDLAPLLRYCEPAFVEVVEEGEQTVALKPGRNPLHHNYDEALRVGLLLLKRFGFSLREAGAETSALVAVPPHWLDMSRLFELYVLGMLKAQFGSLAVAYGELEAKANYGLPDFLLRGAVPWIIDAKYKPQYDYKYLIEDVRQLSGYARDRGVLTKLGFSTSDAQDEAVVRCLVIYPQRVNIIEDSTETVEKFPIEAELSRFGIKQFTRFYKLAVRLPELQTMTVMEYQK